MGPLGASGKGFGISVDTLAHLPGMDREQAELLIHDAHEVCPYSNATLGNVDVQILIA